MAVQDTLLDELNKDRKMPLPTGSKESADFIVSKTSAEKAMFYLKLFIKVKLILRGDPNASLVLDRLKSSFESGKFKKVIDYFSSNGDEDIVVSGLFEKSILSFSCASLKRYAHPEYPSPGDINSHLDFIYPIDEDIKANGAYRSNLTKIFKITIVGKVSQKVYNQKNCRLEEERSTDSRGVSSDKIMPKTPLRTKDLDKDVSGKAGVPNSIDNTFALLQAQLSKFIWQTQFFLLIKAKIAPIKENLKAISIKTNAMKGIPLPLKAIISAISLGVDRWVSDKDATFQYRNQSEIGIEFEKYLIREKAIQVSEYSRMSKDKKERKHIDEWEAFWKKYIFNEEIYISGINFTFLDWFGFILYAFLLPEKSIKMSISLPNLQIGKKFLGYDAEYDEYFRDFINKINKVKSMTFYSFWLNWDTIFYNNYFPNASPKFLIVYYQYIYRQETKSMHIRITRDNAKNNFFKIYEFGQLIETGSASNKIYQFKPYSISDQRVSDFFTFMGELNTPLKSEYLAYLPHKDKQLLPEPILVDEFNEPSKY